MATVTNLPKKFVIGIEAVNYVNKKEQPVHGVRLHCVEALVSPHVGHRAFDVYISNGNIDEYHIGEYVTLLYEPGYNNQYKCTGVLYS